MPGCRVLVRPLEGNPSLLPGQHEPVDLLVSLCIQPHFVVKQPILDLEAVEELVIDPQIIIPPAEAALLRTPSALNPAPYLPEDLVLLLGFLKYLSGQLLCHPM